MPTDAEIKAEKRQQLAGGISAAAAGDLIIPEIPITPLPSDVAKRFPSLADWHNRNYVAWSDWRQRVNVVLARSQEAQ